MKYTKELIIMYGIVNKSVRIYDIVYIKYMIVYMYKFVYKRKVVFMALRSRILFLEV